jgi:hypothetical protein
VLLVDHAKHIGEKIRISGGGRCNFTNLHCRPEHYLSRNPHFCRSALARYTPADFIALVKRHRIAFHEKKLGQLFCDDSAVQIIDMLRAECRRAGVIFALGHPVSSVDHDEGGFRVTLNGVTYGAPSLVLATGGPSIPKMGATGFAYDLARRFGLSIVQPRPALVPFTLGGDDALFTELSRCFGGCRGALEQGPLSRGRLVHASRPVRPRDVAKSRPTGSTALRLPSTFCPDAPADWLLAEKQARPRASLRRSLGRASAGPAGRGSA